MYNKYKSAFITFFLDIYFLNETKKSFELQIKKHTDLGLENKLIIDIQD